MGRVGPPVEFSEEDVIKYQPYLEIFLLCAGKPRVTSSVWRTNSLFSGSMSRTGCEVSHPEIALRGQESRKPPTPPNKAAAWKWSRKEKQKGESGQSGSGRHPKSRCVVTAYPEPLERRVTVMLWIANTGHCSAAHTQTKDECKLIELVNSLQAWCIGVQTLAQSHNVIVAIWTVPVMSLMAETTLKKFLKGVKKGLFWEMLEHWEWQWVPPRQSGGSEYAAVDLSACLVLMSWLSGLVSNCI